MCIYWVVSSCFKQFFVSLTSAVPFLSTEKVTTFVGGSQGLVDGVGKEAKFYHPTGISLDVYAGILYVADHVRD